MLRYGGDYNPEQWPPGTWAEDDELMRRARVNSATVGVFSWSLLEPEEGRYSFGWLDDTLDRLHSNGVGVVLATPTASPPPWFTLAYPEAMPVTPDGVRRTHGSRDTYCAAAPAYRDAARRIAAALAERYAEHPAVWLWHVHNEYGTLCWCDATAEAFRRWLRARYGGLGALNDAWGTAFWSQRYSDWAQVLPPRATQWRHNPTQSLDFRRFWSDELRAAYREQADAIRAVRPDATVTTNFMVPEYQNLDFWSWSSDVDIVAIDHYLTDRGIAGAADTAFGADRARSFNGGRPWLLMEQATSTISAGDRSLTKPPGQMLRDSLAHVARGADAVQFFQWRASRYGAETWHAAMVPHAGADSRVYREVVRLGEVLDRLGEVAGSTVRADTAIVWDADSWWGLDSPILPSSALRYLPALRAAHRTLWTDGVTADFVAAGADLSGYKLVLAPALYVLPDAAAANLSSYVERGGHLAVWYFSGIVDENLHVRLGGYPGALRDLLGVRVEEFHPLAEGETVALSGGATAHTWTEDLRTTTAEPVLAYPDGSAAVTRNRYGAGTAWYVSCGLDDTSYASLLGEIRRRAGTGPEGEPTPGVEVVRRNGKRNDWLFVLNHTGAPATVPATGHELITDRPVTGTLTVPAGGVAVVRVGADGTPTRT